MHRILEVRSCKREGQIINRMSKIPEINIDARLWYELINIFDRDIDEPGITQDFTDEEIIGKLSSGKNTRNHRSSFPFTVCREICSTCF